MKTEPAFGGTQSMAATLTRGQVRRPSEKAASRWNDYGWRRAPDPETLAAEHDAFVDVLRSFGVQVEYGPTAADDLLDSIYVFDPALMCDEGAVLLRPGKALRRDEVELARRDLEAAGIPILGSVESPATVEGGDTLWLDRSTLLVARSHRTSGAGAEALRSILEPFRVSVEVVDVPNYRGPDELVHLMSLVSLLDRDLAVCFPPLLPTHALDLMRDRDIRVVPVPEEEFATQGPNVLAISPRRVVAIQDNVETRRRMESHGVEVQSFAATELAHNGGGGPTCLTRPLHRVSD
jgi:dimethylargininase